MLEPIKIVLHVGRGGGQVVSMLAFFSDDPSSNPADAYSFFCKNFVGPGLWVKADCTKKGPKIIKSLKNPNTKVQQGFQLEYYGFQLEQLYLRTFGTHI